MEENSEKSLVKSRISEDEDENSEGTQAQQQPEFRSLDDNITAIQKVTEKGGLALLLATKICVKIIPYTQNQNYQKA